MLPIYSLQVSAKEMLEKTDIAKELYKESLAVAVKSLGNGKVLIAFKSNEKRKKAFYIWKRHFDEVSYFFQTYIVEEEWLGEEGQLKGE